MTKVVLSDELNRCGAAGAIIALSGALSIGLGPVVKFGSQVGIFSLHAASSGFAASFPFPWFVFFPSFFI